MGKAGRSKRKSRLMAAVVWVGSVCFGEIVSMARLWWELIDGVGFDYVLESCGNLQVDCVILGIERERIQSTAWSRV